MLSCAVARTRIRPRAPARARKSEEQVIRRKTCSVEQPSMDDREYPYGSRGSSQVVKGRVC